MGNRENKHSAVIPTKLEHAQHRNANAIWWSLSDWGRQVHVSLWIWSLEDDQLCSQSSCVDKMCNHRTIIA